MNVFLSISLLVAALCGDIAPASSPDTASSPDWRRGYIRYADNTVRDPSGAFADTLAAVLAQARDSGRRARVLHLGDSHIQADMFTGRVREQLAQSGLNVVPGLVFPFALAGTNNPRAYAVTSTAAWEAEFAPRAKGECGAGLFGVSVSTADSVAEIHIAVRDSAAGGFSRVAVWYSCDAGGRLSAGAGTASFAPSADSVATVALGREAGSARLRIEVDTAARFHLYGIELQSDAPGVEYCAVGVNGASARSMRWSRRLATQLRRSAPDLVILSLGTNDAYNSSYSAATFAAELAWMLDQLAACCPGAPVLVTTPNDHALRGRDMSARGAEIARCVDSLAEARGLAFWDFHRLMGGPGSIASWRADSLAARDQVHLSPRGYRLQGDLFHLALQRLLAGRAEPPVSTQP